MQKFVFAVTLLSATIAHADSFTLPADFGDGPFRHCSGSGSFYSCSGDLEIDDNDRITLTSNLTIEVGDDLKIGDDVQIIANGYSVTFDVDDKAEIGESVSFVGNISANGQIDIKKDTTFVGNLVGGDDVKLDKDISFTGNITSDKKVDLDKDIVFTGNITASDDITIDENVTFTGNLTSSNDITIKKDAEFTGNITASDDISIEKDGNFTGNITAADKLTINDGTRVNGICTPSHPACSGATTGLNCVIFRDEFSSSSYGRNDGNAQWANDWIEVGDNYSASDGDIEISNGRLQLEGDGENGGHSAFGGNPSIEREADLSAYTSATLNFDYFETGQWNGNDDIEVWMSNDGGSSWGSNPIHTFNNDQGSTSQLFSQDISAHISARTRVAFVERANASDEIFYIDNVQIEACNADAPGPLAFFQLDEISGTVSGLAGELIDQSGNSTSAKVLGNADGTGMTTGKVCNGINVPYNDRRALQYGFDSGVDVDDDIGTQGTISFWYRSNRKWSSGGDRMLFDASPDNLSNSDKYFHLMLANNGKLEFALEDSSDDDFSFDSGSQSFGAGEWVHIAVTWNMATERKIFVNGNETRSDSSNTDGRLGELHTLYFGDNRSGYHPNGTDNSANGMIDEVRIYNRELSASQIQTDRDATRSCAVSGPDHYHISHAQIGLTCEPVTVTISAHNADHSAHTLANNTSLSITTSPAVDSITPSSATIAAGSSSTSVLIANSQQTRAPHININVSDGQASDSSGSAGSSDDPALQFSSSGFVFNMVDTSNNPFGASSSVIPTQIGGKPSSSNPQRGIMTLRAVKASDSSNTPECVAALSSSSHAIKLGYQCLDSDQCSANQLFVSNHSVYDAGDTQAIAFNNGASTSNTETVNLQFDANGNADIAFQYNNAGQIALFADPYSIAGGGAINRGISNAFVVRPFGFALDFGSNFDLRANDFSDGNLDGSHGDVSYSDPNASEPQNSSLFQVAGTDFTARLSAVLWQSADDGDADGVPDPGSNLYNNSLATLFGREGSSPAIAISPAIVSPPTGSNGTLNTTFTSAFSNGQANLSLNWSEVGIMDINMNLPMYLGDSRYSASSVTPDVGRFRPASFRVASSDSGSFANACGSFTYAGQPFGYSAPPSFVVEALNAADAVTSNYSANWKKLTTSSFTITSASTTDLGQLGNILNLQHSAGALTLLDNGNGSFNVTLGSDSFCYGAGSPCEKQSNAQLNEFTSSISMTLQTISDGEASSTPNLVLSPDGTSIRYGRLVIEDASGVEISDLDMTLQTQYFANNNWLVNTQDNCTTLDHNQPGELSYSKSPSSLPSNVSVINVSANGGDLGIRLSAPGAGNTGTVDDITPNLDISGETWLKEDWSGGGTLENPSASATFGSFQGNTRQIYLRQNFR